MLIELLKKDHFFGMMNNCLLKAGSILKEGFGTNLTIKDKDGSNNIVTEYDFLSEEAIIKTIISEFPDHGILAEERGSDNETSSYRWIIDPLDGTVNFANRIPVFCVSIALEIGGKIEYGGIFNPITEEVFHAKSGAGSWFNGNRTSVSSNSDLSTSLLATGFPYRIKEDATHITGVLNKIISSGIPIRRLGAAAADLAYTANGRFGGFWETGLNPWDVAAGVLMVRESGGSVLNYDGEEYTLDDKGIIAGNKKVVSTLLKEIKL